LEGGQIEIMYGQTRLWSRGRDRGTPAGGKNLSSELLNERTTTNLWFFDRKKNFFKKPHVIARGLEPIKGETEPRGGVGGQTVGVQFLEKTQRRSEKAPCHGEGKGSEEREKILMGG